MTAKRLSLREAALRVPDGCRLAIGGFALYQHPMALVRELARHDLGDLSRAPVTAAPTAAELDVLRRQVDPRGILLSRPA